MENSRSAGLEMDAFAELAAFFTCADLDLLIGTETEINRQRNKHTHTGTNTHAPMHPRKRRNIQESKQASKQASKQTSTIIDQSNKR